MDITGQLIKILAEQTGQGAKGPWVKQDFIIETHDTYPKKACFSAWGEDKVGMLRAMKMGQDIKVSFNIESREYNERWYTDLRAWKIEAASGAAPSHAAPAHSSSSPAPVLPAENVDGMSFSNNNNDDLPF